MKKAHLVIVPSPGMGHLMATVEFSKLLTGRNDRLFITVLVMKLPSDAKIEAYTESLASSSITKHIEFVMLPPVDDSTNSESHPGSLMRTLIENQKPRTRQIVSKIIDSNSDSDSPRLAGFVVDMFCTTMVDLANEFGVPMYVFYTSSAAVLGLMLHLHTLQERGNLDPVELMDSDAELEIPSFENLVPARVLPAPALENWYPFFFNYSKRLKEAKGIIVNTFEELESHAIYSLSDGAPPIYPVGPILNLGGDKKEGTGGAHQGPDFMKWLDDQPEASVIFLCFGSMGCFEGDQVREIANAIENSGARFLWALRKRHHGIAK